MNRHSRLTTRLAMLASGALAICITGCPTLRQEYGYSYSYDGTKSINGVAGFREMFEIDGWETGHIKRLSPRANKYDTIVWFPTAVTTPGGKATRWFNDWLKEEPRTLVFVARGFPSASRNYFRTTRPNAAPSQRMEYRRREAREAVSADSSISSDSSNGWFKLHVNDRSEASQFGGPWADTVDPPPDRLDSHLTLHPHDAKKDAKLIANLGANTRNTSFAPLLTTDRGPALAARITSSDWPKSQIIVCNSAEYLLNFQLIDPHHQELASQLIAECGEPGRVAFFRSGLAGARVSGEDDGDLAAGLELLTTWPLSMITIHAFGIAILACMILLPIFGRPQLLPKRSTADMRDHVVAIAELMERTQDAQYARERISDYFVHVRGDDAGPWVLPDRPVHSTVAPSSKQSQDAISSDEVPEDRETSEETAISGNQVDGNQVDGNQVDGNQVDGNQVDGNQVDGNQVDGNQVDGNETSTTSTPADPVMKDRSTSDKPDPENSVD